jgi:hypothetical protein
MCSKTNCAICLGNVHNGPYEMSPNFFKQLKISGKHKKKTWPEKLKCGHVFHLKCIKDWFMGERDSSEKCPMCRHKIKFSNKFGSTSRKIYKEKTVKYAKKEELDYDSDSDDVYLGGGMWMDDDVMPPLIPVVSADDTSISNRAPSRALNTYYPWGTITRNEMNDTNLNGADLDGLGWVENNQTETDSNQNPFSSPAGRTITDNRLPWYGSVDIHASQTPFSLSLVDYLTNAFYENRAIPLHTEYALYTIAIDLDSRVRTHVSNQGTQTEDLHITNEVNELYTVENVGNLEPRRLNFDDISVVSDASSADEDALLFEKNDTIKVLPPLFTWNKRTQKKTTKFTHNKRYFARMNVHTCKKWKKY